MSGGPTAIRHLSDVLETYSPALDADLGDHALLDLGDLDLDERPMEACLDEIRDAMAHAASVAHLGVMLGGEHTCSLGGFRGIKRVYPDALLLQADAHLDIREAYEGERFTHASWVYRAGEEFGFGDIFQVGVRSGARDEWRTARQRTAWSSPHLEIGAPARARLTRRPVYLSIDIDVLDPAHAPGTGTLEPGGVSFQDLARFVYSLRGVRLVGLDIMEVSPNLDASNMTALAAAKLVRELVLLARPGRPAGALAADSAPH